MKFSIIPCQNMKSLLILLLFCGIVEYSQEWSFSDENSWPKNYCKKGIAQSPIDIVEDENIIDASGPELLFKNLDQVYDVTVTNEGHMVIICLDTANISVSGGRLPGIYHLDHIVFHWNSGHTLGGERKGLEATFVSCNILFENCDEAKNYHNGQAFISTLYEFQDQDNEILDPIIESLDKIEEANSTIQIKLNPRSLLPNNLKKFYRYWGSSTIPDCIEGKPWTIFEELCKVSQNQVSQFMKLKGENGEALVNTYRCTQNLNERMVFKMTTS